MTHLRRVMAANFFAATGFGLYASGSAVYYTRFTGLTASEVGIGLTVAGLGWLPLSVVIGRFCDRVQARRAVVLTGALGAVLLLSAIAIRGFWSFLIVVTAVQMAVQAAWICREALVADLTDEGSRVTLSSRLRSLFNAGIIAGTGLGGLLLGADRRSAYLALMIGCAAAELVAVLLSLGLPRPVAEIPPSAGLSMRGALRDVPYLALAGLHGVLAIGDIILFVGLPLWLVSQAGLSVALAAWLYGLNALIVIVLQVRLSRAAESFGGALRLLIGAGVVSTTACLVIAFSDDTTMAVGVPLLMLAVALLSVGEIWASAAGWKFRFDLAPAAAQGTWGGVFALGGSVHLVLGPVLVTLLVERFDAAGWIVLSTLFLAVSATAGSALDWARRTRPSAAVVA
ncbi:MFS transporter [Actinoplanes sp. NPDC048796]|uniref:MFS transporter n=1 Tax=unclassified Actinoplanes TaxID=2626549 RepID=UPI0033EC2AFA